MFGRRRRRLAAEREARIAHLEWELGITKVPPWRSRIEMDAWHSHWDLPTRAKAANYYAQEKGR